MNPRNRDKGLMFWTTPYRDKDKLTDLKRNILIKLYNKLCMSLERDHSHYSRSRSRSPQRDNKIHSRDIRRDIRHVRRDSRGGSLKRKYTCKYRNKYKL